MRSILSLLLMACALVVLTPACFIGGGQAQAQQARPVIPNFWDPQERFIKPNTRTLPRLRFLTTTDFPPFSFIDEDKRLVGFHVDLARAICEELEVLPVCQIQALPFEELQSALSGGRGDLALAGIAITQQNRRSLAFSRPYFHLPARFVTRRGAPYREPLVRALVKKQVGVVDGSAHAAYARAHFGQLYVRVFETRDGALNALKKEQIEAVFDDGLALSFWLQAEEKRAQQLKQKNCCAFAGGPYLSQTYFGRGLAVAMVKGNFELESAINFALRSINDKGRFAELYLRYFPIGLF